MDVKLPTIPDAERAEVKARFLADLAAWAPELTEAGSGLFERIATPNWALEWGLPHWLGSAFNLPPDATRELLLSNIYLLAFARLMDDLADGEDRSPGNSAIVLGATLHHLGIRQHVRLFGSRQPDHTAAHGLTVGGRQPVLSFWTYFDDYMAQWLRATLGSHEGPASSFQCYTEADFLYLARRGAPLKICCAAACLLVGREGDILPLTSVLDQLLVGVVLLDDQFDWKADLEAGRYNAFVAYCSDLPQTDEWRETNRQAVLKEIYLRQAARPYFDLIRDRMQKAERSAQSTGCLGLRDFITWYKGEVTTCGAWLADKVEMQLSVAVERFACLPTVDRKVNWLETNEEHQS